MSYGHASYLAQAEMGRRLLADDWTPVGRCNQCGRATNEPLELGAMCGFLFDDMECMGRFRAAHANGQKCDRGEDLR